MVMPKSFNSLQVSASSRDKQAHHTNEFQLRLLHRGFAIIKPVTDEEKHWSSFLVMEHHGRFGRTQMFST